MMRLIKSRKIIPIVIIIVIILSVVGYHRYSDWREAAALEQKQEEEKQAREEAARTQEEADAQRKEELDARAEEILTILEASASDEAVCADVSEAVTAAAEAGSQCESLQQDCAEDIEKVKEDALVVIEQVQDMIADITSIQTVDELLAQIYDADTDTVAMNTGKNSRIFQEFQQEMWKIPDDYPEKLKIYENAVSRISEEWNYTNDEWNYETSTLKVSVEERQTDYTKYWVCHIQTFSTSQLRSALCGGTYGNPRRATSEEVADHNGVIGINGSGFDYGSGIPAPGKSMIKDGEVYNDVYSNGNIMCVTQDGGMFTAIAGMTTEDMLNRGVTDTYCFGPTLVEDGKACEITSAFQQTYRYQRTAVGMVNPGDYYIVVVDGKGSGGSQGMTYEEIQQVFLDLNCQYAYNMDGGGSTTLVFKGRVLNALTDGNERPCADILYFIDAGDGGEGDEIIVHEDEAMLQP